MPYFWCDQYGMKIQACGHLRGHDEVTIVKGDSPDALIHHAAPVP